MMDISSLNRSPVDTAPSTSARPADVASRAEDNKPFDQHLNEQMSQKESAQKSSNTEKNDINQQSEAGSRVASETDESADSDQAEVPVAEKTVLASDTKAPQIEVEDVVLMPVFVSAETANDHQQGLDETQDNQQILPSDGSDLPLLAEDVEQPVILLNASTGVETTVKAPASQTRDKVTGEKNVLTPQGLEIKQTIDVQGPQKTIPALNLAEDVAVSPELMTVKAKMAGQADEIKPAVNFEAKPASVATAITTASLLQQVPGMTSVSSAQLNSATSFIDPGLAANAPLFKSSIPMPMQSPGWSQGVAERVAWMVQGNFQSAEIKLNPAHLGPLEIKMSINDDKANISFISAHAPVREALDQALPRLREMFEQQGLQLGDVDVSQYSESHQQDAEKFHSAAAEFANEAVAEPASDAIQQGVLQLNSSSGVNLYA